MKAQVFLPLKKIAKRQKIKRFCFVMPYLMNMSFLAGFGNLGIACVCYTPDGISKKGWVIACSGRWYTDLVFLIQSNI